MGKWFLVQTNSLEKILTSNKASIQLHLEANHRSNPFQRNNTYILCNYRSIQLSLLFTLSTRTVTIKKLQINSTLKHSQYSYAKLYTLADILQVFDEFFAQNKQSKYLWPSQYLWPLSITINMAHSQTHTLKTQLTKTLVLIIQYGSNVL